MHEKSTCLVLVTSEFEDRVALQQEGERTEHEQAGTRDGAIYFYLLDPAETTELDAPDVGRPEAFELNPGAPKELGAQFVWLQERVADDASDHARENPQVADWASAPVLRES
jgi:hypothetical protein